MMMPASNPALRLFEACVVENEILGIRMMDNDGMNHESVHS